MLAEAEQRKNSRQAVVSKDTTIPHYARLQLAPPNPTQKKPSQEALRGWKRSDDYLKSAPCCRLELRGPRQDSLRRVQISTAFGEKPHLVAKK